MARLKTLPKALIVAAVIGGVGAAAYKFMPAPKPKAASTVVPKPAVTSHFVPPVFHEPAQMPTVQPESRPRTREAVRPAAPPKPAPQTSSPWSNMPERPKREKHFSHSPWSQEGDKK